MSGLGSFLSLRSLLLPKIPEPPRIVFQKLELENSQTSGDVKHWAKVRPVGVQLEIGKDPLVMSLSLSIWWPWVPVYEGMSLKTCPSLYVCVLGWLRIILSAILIVTIAFGALRLEWIHSSEGHAYSERLLQKPKGIEQNHNVLMSTFATHMHAHTFMQCYVHVDPFSGGHFGVSNHSRCQICADMVAAYVTASLLTEPNSVQVSVLSVFPISSPRSRILMTLGQLW